MKEEGKRTKAEGIPLGDWTDDEIDRSGPKGNGNFIYVDISSIDRVSKRIVDPKEMPVSKAPSRAKQILREGDVLVSMTRPNLNAVALVPSHLDGAIGSTGFHVLRPKHADSGFLFYSVQTREFIEAMSMKVQGALYPAVRPNDISAFCLPPFALAHQRRIVAKIEELFSELDAGEESLRRARRQLGVYRQSLLKQAFEGKLTAPWRKQNPELLESPDQLLARIQADRQSQYEKQFHTWQEALNEWEAIGKKGTRPSKPRLPEDPDPPSTEHKRRIWNLPPNWAWIQLGTVAFVTKLAGFEYTKHVRYDDEGDLKVIKAENAGPEGYRHTSFSRIRSESIACLTRSVLHGGELLVVFVGAGTGNVAVVPTGSAYFLGPNIAMARSYSTHADTRFIELFLRSPMGFDLLMAASKAVAQPSLSMGTIRQAPIALPSVPEQQEIVRILDAQFEVIEQNEREIDAALKRSEALRQSILKRAFNGHLVPQDPTDEPASALLLRIREEREKAAKTGKNSKVMHERTAKKAPKGKKFTKR